MPRVTVAICTYKEADSGYLQQSIQSVIDQTYKDLKIIIYDDCSPDNTETIVRGFMRVDSRISYVRNEKNLGLFGNLNKALDCCDTEYIVVFHDDDIMLPHMIETEVKELDEHPDAIIVGQGAVCLIDEIGKIKYETRKPKKIFRKNNFIKENVRNLIPLTCDSIMFRLKRLNELNVRFDTKCGNAADWLMFLEINTHDGEIVILGEAIVKNRVHDSSQTKIGVKDDTWNDTHFYVESWLRKNNLCSDFRALHSYFLHVGIAVFSNAALENSLDLDEVQKKLNSMKEKYDWEIHDWDSLYTGLLGEIVSAVGKHQVPISTYLTWRSKIAKHFGHKPSFKRELKWFLKYVILGRWFGRREGRE